MQMIRFALALAAVLGCNHAPLTEAPDRYALEVSRAWWDDPHTLEVALRIENHTDETSRLEPWRFEVRTLDGARWAAEVYDGPGACHPRRFAEPHTHARCVARFHLDRPPLRVAYLGEGGSAEAPLDVCSPEHPLGLCPTDETCVDGGCEPICSASSWDGACLQDHLVCDRGECVERCSPEGRGCDEGICLDGVCIDACPAIAWEDDACEACAISVLEVGRCVIEEARCFDCVRCPASIEGFVESGDYPLRTCECAEADVCEDCLDQANRAWSCLLEACPACSE